MTKFRMFLSLVFLSMLASCSGLNNDLILDNKEKSSEADYSEEKIGFDCKKKENSLLDYPGLVKTKPLFSRFSSNSDEGEPVTSSDKNDLKSDIQGNCKIKENTLFGLSRTCTSSAILSESLSN